jgi:CheY-like chemotaxis protein
VTGEQRPGRRALVVDDAEAVRMLVRAVLTSDGYEVDLATTLAEAKAQLPSDYDAILIDVQLNQERGTDLIEWLRAVDPAAVGHCLVLSGGMVDDLAPEVSTLAKPFRVEALLDAVRTVAGWQPGVQEQSVPRELTWASAVQEQTGGPLQARDLLTLAGTLRERERQHLADYLHDVPMQELTSVLLGMGMLRRNLLGDAAEKITDLEARLSRTMQSLRSELGAWRAHVQSMSSLDAALRQRISGLLARTVVVDVEGDLPALGPDDILGAVAFVELMLLSMDARNPVPDALITLRGLPAAVEISLAAAGAPVTGAGGAVAMRTRLHRLASAFGADLDWDREAQCWRSTLRVRLTSPAAPGSASGASADGGPPPDGVPERRQTARHVPAAGSGRRGG